MPLVAACSSRCTTRIVRVLNKFCTRSEQSIKTFLTLVDIIEVTKSFLCMKLEEYYLEEYGKFVLYNLLSGLLE